MITKDKRNRLEKFLILLLLLSTQSCALLNGTKKITSISYEIPSNAEINYGSSFQIEFYANYSNCKKKNITGKSDLIVEVDGGSYSKGRIKLPEYPEQWLKDTLTVSASYSLKEDTFRIQENIPFNYRGEVEIDFSGIQGATGTNGADRGTPLVFRNGNDGGDGLTDQVGQNGDDLTVLVWKDITLDLFKIKITSLSQDKTYYYTDKNNGFPFRILSNGGPGGVGGKGGKGGNGKDGVINDKKNKRPGNVGNGGNGGQGGNGGNGGVVYMTFHPNATAIENMIVVYNFPGDGGQGGDGGQAGEPGEPAPGQDSGEPGTEGQPGIMGINGAPGNTIIELQPFDFEHE